LTAEGRFAPIRARMAVGREGARSGGAMGSVAGLANLLPTSVVTGVARSQTANQDFATSNIRGAPMPAYVSGARVLWTGTLGPVAGTAFNLTAMSYDGSFDIGVHADPVARGACDDLPTCPPPRPPPRPRGRRRPRRPPPLPRSRHRGAPRRRRPGARGRPRGRLSIHPG